MQHGYELAKQAGTATDEIAIAATKASDDALLDVYGLARKEQARTTDGARQVQVAEVVNVLGKEIERRGIGPVASKTAADDFTGTSLLHALWLQFKQWLIGHNGYSDYADEYAFASLKPQEGTVNDHTSYAQKEASLLQAMASAPTLERQRELARDLVALRHERTAASQAERDLDLGSAVVRDAMTPVVTAARHSIATDWMGEDATVEDGEITRTMSAAASRFYMGTSDEVRADGEEFEIQATGMAQAMAGQYGEQAPVAVDAFVRHALFLNREPGATAQPRTAGLGINPGVTPLVTKVADQSYADWLSEQGADAHHPEGRDQSAWAQSSPQAADSAEVEKDEDDEGYTSHRDAETGTEIFKSRRVDASRTAADADINPYPANEQAGYAETGLPVTVPTEGYEEEGVVGDYGQEVAPENVAAVEKEGEETPMPGAGDSVPGVTTQSASVRAQANTQKVAERAVKGLAIYPDKRVEDVTIGGYKDGQAIVGGLIEPVGLKDGSTMYVNEEFLYSFGPDDVNWLASDVAGLGGRPEFMLRQPILGPVYILGPVDEEGYDTDITDTARNWVNRVAREASIKPTASALDAGMRSPTLGFATSILSEAARSDYEHHNEDADRMWWEEEGRHGSEPTYCDVCGYNHPGPCPMDMEASLKTAADARPLYEIADEIRRDWKNVYFGAVPYLDAMSQLDKITDRFYAEDAKMQVVYFLSNASTWRGETAKRVKAELKGMIGRKASLEVEAAEGMTCAQCGDSIAHDPAGENPSTYHHTNGTSHDHEAKPASKESSVKTAAYPCTYCAGTGTVSNGAPGMDLGPGFPEFLECPMCHGTKEVSSKDKQKKPYTMHGSKTAGVYCPTHSVWVGDGNRSTHADCKTEQRATDKTAGTDPEDQNGHAESHLPTPEKDTTTAWPWELPEGDVEKGKDASNVAGVPTPGGEAGYPQPKSSAKHSGDGGAYRCEFTGIGETRWSGNGVSFDTKLEAENWAADLLLRWSGADIARVVPTSTPRDGTLDLNDPQIVRNYRTGSRMTVTDPQRLAAFQAAVQTK